ncbi:MAG: hypothetical protein K9N09_02350 [Candidatus Cloacimonetes bacterium]|nr:hypothetical protein [Candidatus Cloacimonadota bacterium]MCF7814858.1 hypothetical protein [Candidatus Cloacimonadota bacterium]MCF7867515.1 hypothetical protein [Candidatus Cloacimonadota bacterium]MCF7882983.1 hypothetical protein [Candidatus Cloacimonadota bacterium]
MIAVYVDSVLKDFQNEIRFTIDFIFNTLGFVHKYISKLEQIEPNDVLIYYGTIEPTSKEAYILAMDKIFFFIPCGIDFYKPGSISRQQLSESIREIKLDRSIPLICNHEIEQPIVYFINENLYYGSVKFDLIGNIFFNLINYQKFSPGREEKDYRIPDDEMVFHDYALIPYTNYYLWLLEQTILEAIEKKRDYFLVKKEYWPKAEKGAVAVSHNVPKLRKWNFKRIMQSVYQDLLVFYKFKYVLKNFRSRTKYILTNEEEYWNFDLIDNLEEKYGIRSTYFWGTDDSRKGEFEYDIGHNLIYQEISRIIDRGHEIALLAKSNSYKNDNFQSQKKQIIRLSFKEKTGLRINGYKSDPYQTNELKLKHSFVYDSSRKLATMAGFANGIGFPFHLSIISKKGKLRRSFANNNNLEIPLICSDESFIISTTNKMSSETAKEIIEKLLDSINLVNGLITFDFSVHNFAELEYLEKLMEEVFKKINNKKYYQDTYLNIAQWWKKRERIEIHERRSSVRLYFPEKIETFSFSIKGNKKLSHVDYTKSHISGNLVTLHDIDPDTEVKVFLDKSESGEK